MDTQQMLSPLFVYKLSILIDTGLIDHKTYYPWADALIAEIDQPPLWLLELSVEKNAGPAVRVLREQVLTPHREALATFPFKDFYGGAYYVKVTQGNLDWNNFLLQAGICADGPEAAISPKEFYDALEKYHSADDKTALQKEQMHWVEHAIPQAIRDVEETVQMLQR